MWVERYWERKKGRKGKRRSNVIRERRGCMREMMINLLICQYKSNMSRTHLPSIWVRTDNLSIDRLDIHKVNYLDKLVVAACLQKYKWICQEKRTKHWQKSRKKNENTTQYVKGMLDKYSSRQVYRDKSPCRGFFAWIELILLRTCII